MIRWLAALIALMLMSSGIAALGAGWPEGCGPEKPYADLEAVDLERTIGYLMPWPREKLPARLFCDELRIYLPRSDAVLGEGWLWLIEATEDGEALRESVKFGSGEQASIRPMDQGELELYLWGEGSCVEIKLAKSLEISREYDVLMEEGCLTAGGSAVNPPIEAPGLWRPALEGDYGVSGLHYQRPDEADAEWRLPMAGDTVTFSLILGGDAKRAVFYSENDSVFLETLEYDAPGEVTGRVESDDVRLGVVFLNEAGDILDALTLAG